MESLPTYFNQAESVYNVVIGIQPQKISWEMEWADIVDLLTAKIPDQKGETKRDD